jgi:hypothetical protein
MTTDNIWNVSRVRVPARSGETIQMINAHDEKVRLNAAELTDTCVIDFDMCVVDLGQFSDNITAGLPLFLPAKPHRSGLHDNDNAPRGY